ncbi:hypothetical protein Hanom_Chr04g00340731 [Helianthus anomalus]
MKNKKKKDNNYSVMVWMHGRIKCCFGYLQKVVRLGRCCHRCWAWGRLNHVGKFVYY